MRCSDEIKSELLDIKWWDFPTEVIKKNFDIFNSELTLDTVKKLREIKESLC